MWADFVVMAALVGLLLWGHRAGKPLVEWVAKPLAAAVFLVSGAVHQDLATPAGQVLFAGLCCAALGDVLLIPKSSLAFLGGLVAFLLGHVGYAVAFLLFGPEPRATLVAAAPLALVAAVVLRWLWPHLPRAMRAPVIAYVAVISAMVALAVGATASLADPLISIGAAGFYLSDLSVAQGRFVKQSFWNRAWGLPLYFFSQLVIARLAP